MAILCFHVVFAREKGIKGAWGRSEAMFFPLLLTVATIATETHQAEKYVC